MNCSFLHNIYAILVLGPFAMFEYSQARHDGVAIWESKSSNITFIWPFG